MISDLPSNQNNFDAVSFSGRLALAAGTAYGIHRTLRDSTLPSVQSMTSGSKYSQTLGSTMKIKSTVADLASKNPLDLVPLGNLRPMMPSTAFIPGFNEAYNALSQATGANQKLLSEFKSFTEELTGRFGYPGLTFEALRSQSGDLLELTMTPEGSRTKFGLNPVTAEGDLLLGRNQPLKYTARQVMDVNPSTGAYEPIDISTGIMREWKRRLPEMLPKFGASGKFTPKVSPREISQQGIGTAVFEDITQGRPFEGSEFVERATASLRKSEVLINPFNRFNNRPGAADAEVSLLKYLMGQGAIEPGSASMTAKGIAYLPGSQLAQMPGSIYSPTGKQLFRTTEFKGNAFKPNVDFLPGQQPFGQFNLGTVSPDKLNRLQEAAKSRIGVIDTLISKGGNRRELNKLQKEKTRLGNLMFGELSEEELLMRKGLNAGMKNQIYQYEVGLSDKSGQISKDLNSVLDKLAGTGTREELLARLQSPGGMRGLKIHASGMTLGYAPEPIGGERKPVKIMNELDQYISSIMITDKQTLKVAVSTEYNMRQAQKVFGSFKGTIKGKVDIPYLLTQLETLEQSGKLLEESGLDRTGYQSMRNRMKNFGSIDFLIPKHPFENFATKGLLPFKEVPTLAQHAILRAAELESNGGLPEAQQGLYRGFLESAGFNKANGRWTNSGKIAGAGMMQSFQTFASSNNMTVQQMLSNVAGVGEQAGVVNVTKGLLAPEFHRFQMGVGGSAPLSQRAFLNILSLLPGHVSENMAGRMIYPQGISPQSQLESVLSYKSLTGDRTVEGTPLSRTENITDDLFRADLKERRGVLSRNGMLNGKDFGVINLGKDIVPEGGGPAIRNVVISARDDMTPYVGKKIGSDNLTDLDSSAKELLNAVRSNDTDRAAKAASRYRQSISETVQTLEGNVFRGKFTGSMYGQAASELSGMSSFAQNMIGKTPEGLMPPVIAMHERDIARNASQIIQENQLDGQAVAELRKNFQGEELLSELNNLKGKTAVSMARQGQLWGLVTREPAEGLHRTMPALVGVAEDLGAKGYNKGLVYFSGQQDSGTAWTAMRKALGVDFDADQTSVIMFADDQAKKTFNEFWKGGQSEVATIGKEFRRTQKFFDIFKLKSRLSKEMDALSLSSKDAQEMLVDIGVTEKKLIAPLSTEFKDIHTGFRQMLAEDRSEASVAKAMRGEVFSLLAIESSLKAKHRPGEALKRSHEILDIMQSGDVANLQSFFDKMTFGNASIGAELRAADTMHGEILQQVQQSMDLGPAEASEFGTTYRELTSSANLEEVFAAKTRGALLRKQGLITESLTGKGNMVSRFSKGLEMASHQLAPLMTKGLKNIAKYGILPTAAIGLAATMFGDGPATLPVEMSSEKHINSTPQPTTIPLENKAWAVPKRERYVIRGQTKRLPNPEQFTSAFPGSNVDMNISDRRAHMTQDYIDRKVKRGM